KTRALCIHKSPCPFLLVGPFGRCPRLETVFSPCLSQVTRVRLKCRSAHRCRPWSRRHKPLPHWVDPRAKPFQRACSQQSQVARLAKNDFINRFKSSRAKNRISGGTSDGLTVGH